MHPHCVLLNTFSDFVYSLVSLHPYIPGCTSARLTCTPDPLRVDMGADWRGGCTRAPVRTPSSAVGLLERDTPN